MRTHVFILAVWFQRERVKALLCVTIMRLVLRSMMKSEAENDMEAETLVTATVVRVFAVMRNLLGVS